jgi:two-component system, OmpR family, response regulator
MTVEITSGAGPKVLVVDDDPVTRSLLGQCLKREGFAVVAASDGMEACSAATSERPDLALVDLLLPRRDGYSVLMYLRSREALRDLPVIIVSAEAPGQHTEIARTLGAQRFLTKPCDLGALMIAVKDVLREKRGTA